MSIRHLALPASLALALVVGACANTTPSAAEGESVGMDKNAKSAACCAEMDKAACAEAKAKCEATKASCDAAKAECAAEKAKTDS
jgi:hypothetical protein